MTPAETAAILRQLHDWLRGGTQWAPTMGAEAVKTAIEMIDRLEAAETDAAHQKALAESALRVAEGWERKCDSLRAKIEQMEQQEPIAWQTRTRPAWNDGTWGPWRKCSEEYAEDIKKTPLLHDWLYEARALYALPGAQTQGEEK